MPSIRREIALDRRSEERGIARAAEQMAERLLETMDTERELPPMITPTLARNPRRQARWVRMTQ